MKDSKLHGLGLRGCIGVSFPHTTAKEGFSVVLMSSILPFRKNSTVRCCLLSLSLSLSLSLTDVDIKHRPAR